MSGKNTRKALLDFVDVLELLNDGNISDIENFSSDESDWDEPVLNSENNKSDDDDQTSANLPNSSLITTTRSNLDTSQVTKKKNIKWRRKSFISQHSYSLLNDNDGEDDGESMTPLSYFKTYINDDEFENMALKTNIYALQNGKTSFKPTNKNEIEALVALHIAMGSIRLPRIKMYWDAELGIKFFSDNMTKNRFFALRNNLHVVNNLERPTQCNDKMFKVRPLYNAIQKRCLQLKTEKNVCVDEQIVPFKGKLSIKQYVKGKPNKWGIKIFVLCGESGICYDFLIYQGASTEINSVSLEKLGLGAAVVHHLTERLQQAQHFLYFDNFFSSYNLFKVLKDKNLYAAGTVRTNRFGKPPFLPDKIMAKKGRGFSEEDVSLGDNIVLVKWYDKNLLLLVQILLGLEQKMK